MSIKKSNSGVSNGYGPVLSTSVSDSIRSNHHNSINDNSDADDDVGNKNEKNRGYEQLQQQSTDDSMVAGECDGRDDGDGDSDESMGDNDEDSDIDDGVSSF